MTLQIGRKNINSATFFQRIFIASIKVYNLTMFSADPRRFALWKGILLVT